MRTDTITGGGLRVRAIAGTHTVLFAFDVVDAALKPQLLGFALGRQEAGGTQPVRWFEGSKVFRSVVPEPQPQQRFSTRLHPVQSLLWGDYTAQPGTRYRYVVQPVLGTPAAPTYGDGLAFEVSTERERTSRDGIWFNRGAIASQAFAERFHNQPPADENNPHDETTAWLSRGLLEACLRFIDDTPAGESLLVAAYEFTYDPVLKALKAALERGVTLQIVFDQSTEKTSNGTLRPTTEAKANLAAVQHWGFPQAVLHPRTHSGDIPHNKFILRLDAQGQPASVWTGSTNFSASGFLGQSNVGHLLHDRPVAQQFLKYWKLLKADLPRDALRQEVEVLSLPEQSLGQGREAVPKGTSVCFSPRTSSRMLKWYAERVDQASQAVMWTGAFGLDPTITAEVAGTQPFPRFLLLEKPPSKKTRQQLKGSKNLLSAYGNVLGQRYVEDAHGELTLRREIPEFALERWYLREELFRRQGHVFFVHTKFLLIDPLGEDPLLFTGSANFSSNSLLANDENMLLIRGNKRAADIYLTEFDRLLRHFFFRDVAANGASDKGKFLAESAADWVPQQFSGFKDVRRRMFFPA